MEVRSAAAGAALPVLCDVCVYRCDAWYKFPVSYPFLVYRSVYISLSKKLPPSSRFHHFTMSYAREEEISKPSYISHYMSSMLLLLFLVIIMMYTNCVIYVCILRDICIYIRLKLETRPWKSASGYEYYFST